MKGNYNMIDYHKINEVLRIAIATKCYCRIKFKDISGIDGDVNLQIRSYEIDGNVLKIIAFIIYKNPKYDQEFYFDINNILCISPLR